MSIVSVAAMMALGEIGLNPGPLIAGAGIVGLAVGFGDRDLVRDFLTGFVVLLEDQYAIGDKVEVAAAVGPGATSDTGGPGGNGPVNAPTPVGGRVERFTLRMTSLRAQDGTLHHIANRTIQRVSNSSAGRATALVDIGVGHEADLGKAEEALARAGVDLMADTDAGSFVLEPPRILGPEALSGSEVTIRIAIGTIPGKRALVARAYRRLVKQAFERAGVPLPVPSRVLLRTDGG